MAKKNYKFKVGADLSDGRRFEAGDDVPADIKKLDLDALLEMDAIEEVK